MIPLAGHAGPTIYVLATGAYIATAPRRPGLLALEVGLAVTGVAGYLVQASGRGPVVQATCHVLPLIGALCALLLAWRDERTAGAKPHRAQARTMGTDHARTWVLALAIVYAAGTLNPLLGGWPIGPRAALVGWASILFPLVHFWVGRRVLRHADGMRHAIGLWVLMAALTSGFAVVQLLLGPDYVASLGADHARILDRDRTWGPAGEMVVRTPGFAADAGRSACLSMLGILLGISLLGTGAGHAIAPALGISVCALGLACASSRALLLALAAGLAVHGAARPGRWAWVVAIAAVVTLAGVPLAGPGTLDRITSAGDAWSDLSFRWEMLVHEVTIVCCRFPMGAGIGRAGPGANALLDLSARIPDHPSESLLASLAFEGGPLLVVLAYGGLATALAGGLARVARGGRDRTLTASTAVLAALTVLSLAGPVLYVSPVNILLWTCAALATSPGTYEASGHPTVGPSPVPG